MSQSSVLVLQHANFISRPTNSTDIKLVLKDKVGNSSASKRSVQIVLVCSSCQYARKTLLMFVFSRFDCKSLNVGSLTVFIFIDSHKTLHLPSIALAFHLNKATDVQWLSCESALRAPSLSFLSSRLLCWLFLAHSSHHLVYLFMLYCWVCGLLRDAPKNCPFRKLLVRFESCTMMQKGKGGRKKLNWILPK